MKETNFQHKVRTHLQVHNMPMATLKINWLRAGIAFFVLLIGVFFVVKATEKKEDNLEKKTTFTAWYNVQNPSSPEVYGEPINEPDLNNPQDCAQNNTTDLCAIELEVPSADYEFTNPEKLTDLTSLGIQMTGNDAHRTP